MNKREKTLGIILLLVLVLAAHAFLGVFIKKQRIKQIAELDELKTELSTYSMMESGSQLIKEDVTWVDQHTPPATSYLNAQTALHDFLISSSKSLNFTPYAPVLTEQQETEESGAIYQRVRNQISARATEKQIYEWLVKIHQPGKMRTLSYLKLSPPVNDSDLINCQIIAEQYIITE